MEGRNKSGSSSFTSDLFGSKESPVSPSSGIFGSIFAPPSKVVGRESLHPEVVERKLDSASQAWNTKNGPSENNGLVGQGEHMNDPNKARSSFYQENKVQQPCHLSSSIYYGGQDVYAQPQNTQSSVYSTVSSYHVKLLCYASVNFAFLL
ncbi:OLC1v1034958C1 [Oldenlandia corymbosa var. corymbosa]|uniref:OLC1v1034958C1 n=1 Tax=Oldenlandia corymbosa var. corymbosa TaxID=529605 RepID=A0AAV1CSL6_OLDCO|nr:OLC1v1034958C1 [Oldenlandia corymbosa var. corymbosa]